jgi:hypothetical protein
VSDALAEAIPILVPAGLGLLALLYWMFIVVPRRTRRIFARLASQGYRVVDPKDPDLELALSTLPPIYQYDPVQGFDTEPWQVRHVVAASWGDRTRYVVDAVRGQRELGGGTSARRAYVLRYTVMVLEQGSLELPCDLHVSVRGVARLMAGIDERQGLTEAKGEQAAGRVACHGFPFAPTTATTRVRSSPSSPRAWSCTASTME